MKTLYGHTPHQDLPTPETAAREQQAEEQKICSFARRENRHEREHALQENSIIETPSLPRLVSERTGAALFLTRGRTVKGIPATPMVTGASPAGNNGGCAFGSIIFARALLAAHQPPAPAK